MIFAYFLQYYSVSLNCANVCLCKSLSELQIFKLTRNGSSISSKHIPLFIQIFHISSQPKEFELEPFRNSFWINVVGFQSPSRSQ